jgi:hypothetical protein
MRPVVPLLTLTLLLFSGTARSQGIAYGSITNFDTVNDTGHVCHGFEIELEDCRSIDIGHTYDYNHYGAPRITEDNTVPAHPVCRIRWESRKNVDGSWAAYTAIPSGPIAPTDGHQFTNPNVNFGGEHFGVGYGIQPGAIRYFWLIDDGAGNLVRGGQVQVAAPSFHYYPPQGIVPAQIQAVIAPPEPPEIPAKEFGEPVWVKEIRTTSHNNQEIHLRDLVSDDPEDDNDPNWRNGEPDEIEVEWQLLQTEFSKPDQGMGKLVAGAENLDNGDEVVTRRYEFFEYIGPLDEESGEAEAGSVGPDDLHGAGLKVINGVEVDLATIEVVGEYKGAQMAAVNVYAATALIDHIGDGVVNEPYADRTIVVPGAAPFTASGEGVLPSGMSFDPVTGVLSGTPTEVGQFEFQVTATDGVNPAVTKNYRFSIYLPGEEIPPLSLVDTSPLPVDGGTTSGDGEFLPGSEVTVTASPAPGFRFVEWVDNGEPAGTDALHTFIIDVNHSFVARFEALPPGPIPDATIGTTLSRQIGDGVYLTDGSMQTIRQTSKKNRSAHCYFKIQNDSGGPDEITVTATPGDRHLGLTYYNLSDGRRNVTALLTRSGFRAQLAPRGEVPFMAVMTPNRRSRRGTRIIVIEARSAGNIRDEVRSSLRIK